MCLNALMYLILEPKQTCIKCYSQILNSKSLNPNSLNFKPKTLDDRVSGLAWVYGCAWGTRDFEEYLSIRLHVFCSGCTHVELVIDHPARIALLNSRFQVGSFPHTSYCLGFRLYSGVRNSGQRVRLVV